jgi:hypothetical protein
MDNLNDLKKIWLSADTRALPDAAAMKLEAQKYRSGQLVKKSAIVLMSVLLTVVMGSVVINYKSVMLTTRLGEALMILAGLLLVVTNMRSVARLYRVKDMTNREFIAYLEQVQRNRIYYYKNTQVLGMALVGIGLLLYLYEMVSHSILWTFVGYGLTIGWLAVNWFIIRPRAYRRNARKLDEKMKKMAAISKQF